MVAERLLLDGSLVWFYHLLKLKKIDVYLSFDETTQTDRLKATLWRINCVVVTFLVCMIISVAADSVFMFYFELNHFLPIEPDGGHSVFHTFLIIASSLFGFMYNMLVIYVMFSSMCLGFKFIKMMDDSIPVNRALTLASITVVLIIWGTQRLRRFLRIADIFYFGF